MALKDNIKSQRINLGMTLEDLAQKVGVSRQTIQRYESGVISNIPSDNIEKISLALQTTPAYLMGWEDRNNSDLDKRNEQNEKDVTKMVEDLRRRLSAPGITYEGKPVTPEEVENLISGIQIGLEIAIQRNKNKK